MTKESPILMLGVQYSPLTINFPIRARPVLYWDVEKGNNGYHSIVWESAKERIKIKSVSYIWGTAHEEQAGVILEELRVSSQKSCVHSTDVMVEWTNAL